MRMKHCWIPPSIRNTVHLPEAYCTKLFALIRRSHYLLVHCKPWQWKSIVYAPTVVNIDSSAAQALTMNKQTSVKTKHIDLKYHSVKNVFKRGIVILQVAIPTENSVDMLTKILDFKTLKHLTRIIGSYYNWIWLQDLRSSSYSYFHCVATRCDLRVHLCTISMFLHSDSLTVFSIWSLLDNIRHFASPVMFVGVLMLLFLLFS